MDGDRAVPQFEPQAYDIRSFCAAYSVSRSFAYLEIKAGRLKPLKAGRRTLIPRQAAEDWLNALDRGLGKPAAKTKTPSPARSGRSPQDSDDE
jgi:hypothetical protein